MMGAHESASLPVRTARLVRLGPGHQDPLRQFLGEFETREAELHGYHLDSDAPHEEVVRLLAAWSDGRDLRPGWVPQTTWFWEVGGEFAGVISLRHELTPQLERHGGHIGYSTAPSWRGRGVATAMLLAVLQEARGLGLTRVLLTCDAANEPSWKTILRCGGVLVREEEHPGLGRRTRAAVIELDAREPA
jgi:predicted acetyltransferase